MTADAECGIVDRMDHEHDAVPEVDYRATSVRTPWAQLPEPVRAAVQQVCGCPVLAADPPVTSGFSGGSASVLHLADGRRVFAKAGYGANEHLLSAYRKEAEVLAVLPPTVPAPRPVGSAQMAAGLAGEHPWQIVVSQAVSGRMPMPWTEASLDAVHTACVAATTALTPPPRRAPVGWSSMRPMDYARDPDIVTALPALAAGELALVAGQPAWLRGRLADLQALVELGEVALVGEHRLPLRPAGRQHPDHPLRGRPPRPRQSRAGGVRRLELPGGGAGLDRLRGVAAAGQAGRRRRRRLGRAQSTHGRACPPTTSTPGWP